MLWIGLSLISAFFYSLRYIVIKKYLGGASSFVIAFSMRFFGALAIAPFAFTAGGGAIDDGLFWAVIFATASLTGISSLIQFHAVKNFEISASLPFLSFVPFFMTFWAYLIFGSAPGIYSSFGMLLLCSGAYALNREKGKGSDSGPAKTFSNWFYGFFNGGGALFFVSAAILGLTTVLDKLAIENAGAGGLRYSICWNAFSALLFSPFFFMTENYERRVSQFGAHLGYFALQGVLGIAAFASQMLAVEYCKDTAANVIYVKSLTMLQILFAVVIASFVFDEKNGKARLAASIAMVAGAALIAAAR